VKVKDLLAKSARPPVTISADNSIYEAMQSLVDQQIGSLIVIDDNGALVGIITERDIFRLSYRSDDDIKKKKVADHMSRDLVIGLPDDEIDYIARVITQNRIRHIPIIDENNQLVGIVSIGDIVKAKLDQAEVDIRYLTEFITGRSKTASEHKNNKSV
jgi:CBS domain-containing protein